MTISATTADKHEFAQADVEHCNFDSSTPIKTERNTVRDPNAPKNDTLAGPYTT